MGTTSRFGLRYPEQGDETNVPLDITELAEDVEDWTSRLFQCTSSTRPAGVPAGFMARETDTSLVIVYNGATWDSFGAGSGGGGGSSGGGRYTATGAGQSIPNTTSGPGTVCAFGTTLSSPIAPTLLTRTAEGAGHKFALGASGVWACGASVRVTNSSAAGEVSASIWADLAGGTSFDYNVAPDGGRREGLPRTLQPSRTTYLPSGTTLVVYVYNGTGGTRTLEPNGGAWVNIDLWLVG